jgi:hypothetical protein
MHATGCSTSKTKDLAGLYGARSFCRWREVKDKRKPGKKVQKQA